MSIFYSAIFNLDNLFCRRRGKISVFIFCIFHSAILVLISSCSWVNNNLIYFLQSPYLAEAELFIIKRNSRVHCLFYFNRYHYEHKANPYLLCLRIPAACGLVLCAFFVQHFPPPRDYPRTPDTAWYLSKRKPFKVADVFAVTAKQFTTTRESMRENKIRKSKTTRRSVPVWRQKKNAVVKKNNIAQFINICVGLWISVDIDQTQGNINCEKKTSTVKIKKLDC